MSIEVLSIVLHHSRAQSSAKLILTALAWHHGEDRMTGCWPAQETLAKYANITSRQVRRCINELVDLGELYVIKNGASRSRSAAAPNLYIVQVDCPPNCDGTLSHRITDEQDIYDLPTGHLRLINRTSMTDEQDTDDLLINNKQTVNQK
jgi:hypothetical protein